MNAGLGPVTIGARQRLTDHYGLTANRWLNSVPKTIDDLAAAWNLTVTGYHDAGCASVIALACDDEHVPYVIKAWYEPSRYRHEVVALRRWAPRLAPEVTHAADHLAVAAMRVVANRPGGAAAPADEYDAVARGLHWLHSQAVAPTAFPSLASYLDGEVLPRIYRRAVALGDRAPESCLLRGMAAVNQLPARSDEPVLLHADLYRENVLFGLDGSPVFIDPLPMVGDRAFDWSFWTVYYDLGRDPSERLLTAVGVGGICVARLLPWCLMLCLDGLLYYIDTADPRATRMVAAMGVLDEIWRSAVS
jgi:streptomycin 6-kinase